MQPEVLFCDNHLLVLNKPAGLLTQPNHTTDPSLEQWGKVWVKEKFSKPGNVFLHAVHRIDRSVSGIVLFARSSKALSRLHAAQREGLLRKSYLALVEGSPPQEEGSLEHYLVHDSFRAKVTSPGNLEGKKCILKYRALKKTRGYTLLSLLLLSGRYHQIRAQLGAIGCPILGDQKYGSNSPFDMLTLHHGHLAIPHPITQEILFWETPPPAHWPAECRNIRGEFC